VGHQRGRGELSRFPAVWHLAATRPLMICVPRCHFSGSHLTSGPAKTPTPDPNLIETFLRKRLDNSGAEQGRRQGAGRGCQRRGDMAPRPRTIL